MNNNSSLKQVLRIQTMEIEKCPECQKGQLIKEGKDAYGNFRKEYSCGHARVDVIVQDYARGIDTVSVEILFDFRLSDRVYIGGRTVSSEDIELRLDPSDKKHLIGFTIKLRDLPDETARIIAFQKAKRLINLLSIMTRSFVYHDQPTVTKIGGGKTERALSFTADAFLVKDFDLDLSQDELSSLLAKNSKLNQQVLHATRGIKASQESDPVDMLKEFYQVIEGEVDFPRREQYEYLRNGVSHLELDERTINALKNQFGLECTRNPETGRFSLDTSSPVVIAILIEEANKLKDAVLGFLEQRLKSEATV